MFTNSLNRVLGVFCSSIVEASEKITLKPALTMFIARSLFVTDLILRM
jgi:hypothetical protein